MPDYFFHVLLELFPDEQHSLRETPADLNLPQTFDALRPFLSSTRPRSTRNIAFDQRTLTVSKPANSLPSQLPSSLPAAWPHSPKDDHRLDYIQIECANMGSTVGERKEEKQLENQVGKGIGTSISGAQTKGRYEPIVQEESGEEWGIVHLYRDAMETQGLYRDSQSLGNDLWNGGNGVVRTSPLKPNPPPKDEDCTSLCILAVPSYLTAADFLAFVGEETRDHVSHFRMIRTSRANRYMVLMKFKNGRKARDWQREWNGKIFNSMEPETCHVVFLKSVEITQSPTNVPEESSQSPYDGTRTYPRMNDDPFSAAPSTKPLAPRTPALVELPTCPVCLERMDETTGLLTILCQHVFHCTCLQKWSGGGCPVCRYTHDDFSTGVGLHKYKSRIHASEYEVVDEPLECETCHTDTGLWQCLICGKVGCGRYQGKHAYKHFEETGHTFSMDLDSKRVWDYAADVYVHRIIQDAAKPGEKLVELPGRARDATITALEVDEDIEGAKMENVALEYTHLLTSQLESQRVYFDEVVERAADKASQAGKVADEAVRECEAMRNQMEKLTYECDHLLHRRLPELEAENQRLEKRSAKFEDMAKSLNTKYLEEKSLASSLMERVKHLTETKIVQMQQRIQELEEDSATNLLLMEGFRDELRDAMMQVSAQTKLKEMVEQGELDEEDLVGATIQAGPAAKNWKDKSKAQNSVSQTPSTRKDTSGSELQTQLGFDTSTYETGPNWSSDARHQILEEYKARLLAEGMVVEKTTNAGKEVLGDDPDEPPLATGPSKSKKRRAKGKNKK